MSIRCVLARAGTLLAVCRAQWYHLPNRSLQIQSVPGNHILCTPRRGISPLLSPRSPHRLEARNRLVRLPGAFRMNQRHAASIAKCLKQLPWSHPKDEVCTPRATEDCRSF